MIGKINSLGGGSGGDLSLNQTNQEPSKKDGLWINDEEKIKKVKFLAYQPNTYTPLPVPIMPEDTTLNDITKYCPYDIIDHGCVSKGNKIYLFLIHNSNYNFFAEYDTITHEYTILNKKYNDEIQSYEASLTVLIDDYIYTYNNYSNNLDVYNINTGVKTVKSLSKLQSSLRNRFCFW